MLNSPDYTLLYAVDVGLNSCKVIVDYGNKVLIIDDCAETDDDKLEFYKSDIEEVEKWLITHYQIKFCLKMMTPALIKSLICPNSLLAGPSVAIIFVRRIFNELVAVSMNLKVTPCT